MIRTIGTQEGKGLVRHAGDLDVALALLVAARQVDVRVGDAVRHADVPGTRLALW